MTEVYVGDLDPWFVRIVAFVWGALWGSFFNVAIYRWPRDMSVITPPSHCPSCGAPVPAFRNVPIFAYLWQRGRAACCGAKLTPRYVFVELVTALLVVGVAEHFVVHADPGLEAYRAVFEAFLYFVFVGGLVVATFADLEHMIIPDEVGITGSAFALATMAGRNDPDVLSLMLGAGGGYLVLQSIGVAWQHWRGQQGMGEGDAKLMLFIGLFLGYQGVLFTIAAGALQGVIGYVLLRRTKLLAPKPLDDEAHVARGPLPLESEITLEDPGRVMAKVERAEEGDDVILTVRYADPGTETEASPADGLRLPFGPFLSLAALEFLFFGGRIIDAYVSLFT